MTECWINIYFRHGRYWYGTLYADKWRSDAAANRYRVYRIHAKMVDEWNT